MTDTTQPHPEPSEEASSLPVYAFHLLWPDDANGIAWNEWYEADDETRPTEWDDDASPEECIAVVRLSDAQSQLSAMRAERDKWYQEAAAQAASAIAAHDELEALKAAPVVDVEAIKRDARAEALRNFRHEHGQDFSDAKKWREWQDALRLIEEEMPEGYSVTLVCSPGDWDLRFTDPECEDIRIDDYESTDDFIRTAVTHAKEHVRSAATMAQTKEG